MFGDVFFPEPRSGILLRRYSAGALGWDVAVSVPQGPVPDTGFPLLVVTDGALHFDAAAAAARVLARRPLKTGVGPTIVVGIASGLDWGHDAERRERELLADGTGNAALHQVLATLLADVAAIAPVDPARRGILGHSFGGLFALDALTRAPHAFTACMAISPSFWRAPELAARVAGVGPAARILLASGAREPRVNADLPAAAQALAAGGAAVRHITLPDEDHGSIPFAALPMALRFLHGVSPMR